MVDTTMDEMERAESRTSEAAVSRRRRFAWIAILISDAGFFAWAPWQLCCRSTFPDQVARRS